MARARLSVASLVSILLLGTHCAEATNGTAGTGGTGTAGTGGTGTAGTGGTAGTPISACPRSDEAVTFCRDSEEKYGDACGFGGPDRFVNRADCENTYDAHKESNRACVEMHLGFAAAGNPDTHCPHAGGAAPCEEVWIFSDGAIAFCGDYETTCGFKGADRYPNRPACESSYDSFSMDRQDCVEQHVGFAMSDPATHCPHAMGESPCDAQ